MINKNKNYVNENNQFSFKGSITSVNNYKYYRTINKILLQIFHNNK